VWFCVFRTVWAASRLLSGVPMAARTAHVAAAASSVLYRPSFLPA
jgi:hypothetical protein